MAQNNRFPQDEDIDFDKELDNGEFYENEPYRENFPQPNEVYGGSFVEHPMHYDPYYPHPPMYEVIEEPPHYHRERYMMEKMASDLEELKKAIPSQQPQQPAQQPQQSKPSIDVQSELKRLRKNMAYAERDFSELEESVSLSLIEIADKLDAILYGTGENNDDDNIQLLLADVADIKEKIFAVDETLLPAVSKLSDNVLLALRVIEARQAEQVSTTKQKEGLQRDVSEEMLLVLEDLTGIKEKVRELSEDGYRELKDCVAYYSSKETEYLDVELVKIYDSLKQIQLDVSSLAEISGKITGFSEEIKKTNELEVPLADDMGLILDELAVLREEVKIGGVAPASTNDNINMLINEVVDLRDEIQAYRNELVGTVVPVPVNEDLSIIKAQMANLTEQNAMILEQNAMLLEALQSQSNIGAVVASEPNEQVLLELQALRDQIFGISMAQIEGGKGKNAYESYNNIILDELNVIKSQLEKHQKDNSTKEKLVAVSKEVLAVNKAVESIKKEIIKDKGNVASKKQVEVLGKELSGITTAVKNLNKEVVATATKTAKTEAPKKAVSHKKNSVNDLENELSKSLADFQKELTSIADFASKPATEQSKKKPTKKKSIEAAEEEKPQAKATTAELKAKSASKPEAITSVTPKTIPAKKPATLKATTAEKSTAIKGKEQPKEEDLLDIASVLAKQVANKLVMEQLVHKLGDGEVTQSKVEELVNEILPQEFTTLQLENQSDQVRRLANSLVLDKLKDRLKGNE
ncbi:MAG: hypothetical protein FWE13_01675 [Firmicutes bacterium]|nr:hypothetical protein [Bacillota bacterium]